MKILKRLIHTIGFWTIISSSFVIHSLIAPVVALFSKRSKRDVYFYLIMPFIRLNQWTTQMPLTVYGRENIPKEGGFILISNHQSLADIPLYMLSVNKPIAFFAKKELLRVPILGSALVKMEHESVDRSSPKNAIKEMNAAVEKIKNGKRVMVFPEGTRSVDETLLPFKKGAFMMSVQSGCPIVPACIQNSGYAIHKTRWYTQPSPVTITFLTPLFPKENSKEEAERLRQEAHKKIKEVLDKKQ